MMIFKIKRALNESRQHCFQPGRLLPRAQLPGQPRAVAEGARAAFVAQHLVHN